MKILDCDLVYSLEQMKKLIFPLIFFPVINSMAQKPHKIKPEIIILTGKTQHITRIKAE